MNQPISSPEANRTATNPTEVIGKLKDALGKRAERLEAYDDIIAGLRRRNEDLHEINVKLHDTNRALKEDMATLQSRHEREKREMETGFSARLHTASQDLEACERQIQALTLKASEEMRRGVDQHQRVVTLQTALSQAQTMYGELEYRFKELQSKTEERINQMSLENERTIHVLTRKHEEERVHLAGAKRELQRSLEEASARHAMEMQDTRRALEETQRKLADLVALHDLAILENDRKDGVIRMFEGTVAQICRDEDQLEDSIRPILNTMKLDQMTNHVPAEASVQDLVADIAVTGVDTHSAQAGLLRSFAVAADESASADLPREV